MIDKQHTFMNMEDEHEYEQFYDFSKTYENHPETAKQENDKDAESKTEEAEWEDVDLEDANEDDLEDDDDEINNADADEKENKL